MKYFAPIYNVHAIKRWEKRWFANNSSFGLMQQAALALTHQIIQLLNKHAITQSNIIIWCGTGNNGGDGYFLGQYLYDVLDKTTNTIQIFAPKLPIRYDGKTGKQMVSANRHINITNNFANLEYPFNHTIHIDALFGTGLNNKLNDYYQSIIHLFNEQSGLKIAVDIPSGLHPDTGVPLPICTNVDYTLCVMGLKIGLFTGFAKAFVGHIINLPLIPKDELLKACAYLSQIPRLPKRNPITHKGDFGSVAIIGGYQGMGGAAMMAAAAAMASGAGKVTVYCHKDYHSAVLSYLPSAMVEDIENFGFVGKNFDIICFGMGLGRGKASEKLYDELTIKMALLAQYKATPVILDADALYFMSQKKTLGIYDNWIGTPHASEAGRLLKVSADVINQDRQSAIKQLKKRYGGNWVLKGANTLTLGDDDKDAIFVCPFGNAGMATAGMGDVLAGMIAGFFAQKSLSLSLADVVSIHALAGDKLASQSPIVSACDMPNAIKEVIKELTI